MDKFEFYKDLMVLKTSTVYEKKKVEEYDPQKELEEREFNVRYDEEDVIKESDIWDDVEEEIEEFSKDVITTVEFTNVRISKKFELNLVPRYKDIIDRETLFGFAQDIISKYIYEELKDDYIHIADKKTVNEDGKLGYHDDISRINFRLDKRINKLIDQWRGTYEVKKGKESTFYSPPVAESLDTELHITDEMGKPLTIGDMATDEANIFYDDMGITNKELDRRLNKIYKQAKLTNKEIEVLKALERTPSNRKGEIYTKALVTELLNCGSSNISNIFANAKRKIMKIYRKENRQDKLIKLNEFFDSIKSEREVIEFILKDLDQNYMEYLLYYSKLDSDLVQYFNLNNENTETYYTSSMRKFCTYFIKEVYRYEELIKDNLEMETAPKEPLEETEKWKYKDIDTDIYTYVAEDKLQEHERTGKHIIMDSKKYYYVSSKKEKAPTQTVGNYKKITYLKR